MLFFWWDHPNALFPRMNQVGFIESGLFAQQMQAGESFIAIWSTQLGRAFGAFLYQPDASLWYATTMPLLDHLSAVCFYIGAALIVRQWKHPVTSLLFLWFIIVHVFGGVLLVAPPASPRFVAAIPPVCIIIAVGIDGIVTTLSLIWQRAPLRTALCLALLLGGSAWWNTSFYFKHIQQPTNLLTIKLRPSRF